MKIGMALSYGIDFLKSVSKPENDAVYILSELLGVLENSLYINAGEEISDKVFCEYKELLKKRASGLPAQYILKRAFFMDHSFYVDENVLIPRPETELLVEKVISFAKSLQDPVIIEIGTGSGCISVSAAAELKKNGRRFHITASDISGNALSIARKNAESLGVEDYIHFIESDIFNNLSSIRADIIVSNPPYIETPEISNLNPEVKNCEPRLALDGGIDGLNFYRMISSESGKFLNKNGYICFEIGYNQGKTVSGLLRENGFADVHILKDYAGFDRIITGRLP